MTVKEFVNTLDERDKYTVDYGEARKGTVKTFIIFVLHGYINNNDLEKYYNHQIKNIYYKRSTPHQMSQLIIELKEG